MARKMCSDNCKLWESYKTIRQVETSFNMRYHSNRIHGLIFSRY